MDAVYRADLNRCRKKAGLIADKLTRYGETGKIPMHAQARLYYAEDEEKESSSSEASSSDESSDFTSVDLSSNSNSESDRSK